MKQNKTNNKPVSQKTNVGKYLQLLSEANSSSSQTIRNCRHAEEKSKEKDRK